MPIEIRELVIKTDVTMGGNRRSLFSDEKELVEIKKQVLEECKRLIRESTKKRTIKR